MPTELNLKMQSTLAIVFGDISAMDSVPVRIHREKVVEDIFGTQGGGHRTNILNSALNRIEALKVAFLIYLRTGFVGVPHENLPLRVKRRSGAANGLKWVLGRKYCAI